MHNIKVIILILSNLFIISSFNALRESNKIGLKTFSLIKINCLVLSSLIKNKGLFL